MHRYLLVASLLDPRVTDHLGGTGDDADYLMLPDHSEVLRLDVVDHMIAYCFEHNICVETSNAHPTTGSMIERLDVVNTVTLDKEELIFGGMERMKMPQKLAGETD